MKNLIRSTAMILSVLLASQALPVQAEEPMTEPAAAAPAAEPAPKEEPKATVTEAKKPTVKAAHPSTGKHKKPVKTTEPPAQPAPEPATGSPE